MQSLLPREASILKNRTILFYFFKLNNSALGAKAIKDKFKQVGGESLHWFECEYAFIGDSENEWTHAAIFKFASQSGLKDAVKQGINSDKIDAIQGFAVKETKPPGIALFVLKLLRPLGALVKYFSKETSIDEVIEMTENLGGIHPSKDQLTRHFQNKRTSSAIMINLLQTYKIARYPKQNNSVSGAIAYYRKYGLVAVRSVYMLGGKLVLSGRMGKPIIENNAPTLTSGSWEGLGIMEYPNPSQLIALEKMPGYQKAYLHRNAGLEKTVLIISKKG